MDIVDLRSDTVTHPTPAMREAMAKAEVGDDVFGEDPTINRLQEMAAERMGKEAGLFVPSGTMGNLLAILTHCGRGDEAIMGHMGHTFLFEVGGMSALGSVFAHTIPNQPDGSLKLDDIRAGIRGSDIHEPITRLIILENTQNRCGGVVLSANYTRQVSDLAKETGLKLHLDGARIFNAAVAQGVKVGELAAPADSVTFCLSKGLCAPVGSVLCGSKEFINKARHTRKQLGGGMRQAGILAAAGIVALEQMVDRLAEDHRRAKLLAEKLATVKGLQLTFGMPQTNMVFVNLEKGHPKSAGQVETEMAGENVKIEVTGPGAFRLVTHYWITNEGVDQTVQAFRRVV
jgi:threonine aldolase